MAFSFGFSGDDIDIEEVETNNDINDMTFPRETKNDLPELVKASKHDMNQWLSILPSQVSFNQLPIPDTSIVIARREIFDIRTQLMAEDSAGHDNEELIAGIEHGDLKPNFYEGGFKTWECALDLAKLIANDNTIIESLDNPQTNVHIIELGAGTAVPSVTLFAHVLDQTETSEGSSPQRKIHFTFADYNAAVLRLVTLPNLLLTWYNCRAQSQKLVTEDQQTPQVQQEEELDITPELVEDFKNDLTRRGILIDFISGAWSPDFVELALSTRNSGGCKTLILASETIYSPSALGAFSETLLALLRRSSSPAEKSRALVAAKKVYFGVGGGVDEFMAVMKEVCANEIEIQQAVDVQCEGVGRVVLEIKPAVDDA